MGWYEHADSTLLLLSAYTFLWGLGESPWLFLGEIWIVGSFVVGGGAIWGRGGWGGPDATGRPEA